MTLYLNFFYFLYETVGRKNMPDPAIHPKTEPMKRSMTDPPCDQHHDQHHVQLHDRHHERIQNANIFCN